jgi:acetyltransferase-like isoleucine patch superfamily enzyme
MITRISVKILNWLLCKLEIEKNKNLFPKSATIKVSEDLVIGSQRNIQIPSPDITLTIKHGVGFRQFCNILIYKYGELIIGENVFFNNYCSINCLGKIEIGANTLFGEGVKIYDHNHLFYSENKTLIVERDKHKIGRVKIGKNCWIGSNVTILNNVEIGDDVIIGANNLIYKSIPSNAIVKSKTDLQIEIIQ